MVAARMWWPGLLDAGWAGRYKAWLDKEFLQMARSTKAGFAVLSLAAIAMLGGCYLVSDDRAAQYRANPSPDMATLHESGEEIDNALTVTFDENLRMFTQDLGRAFYTNRPSRLTREPIPQP
ncbi:MAG: hypothetical protein H7Y88_03745 [Phycisphaerales bacterium]|nr:hypothetical protein [Phycisphaerales bacterium]